MCGIVGIIRLSDRPLPEAGLVRRLMSTIDYRGPDDSGEFRDSDVHIGAVRLAIVDPKEGVQPARGCSSDIVAFQNGEIYNHHALRQALTHREHRLASQCDTEAIPHAYEEYGADFVTRLRGMFSIALWDSKERRLLLARDRMGIKPLFFCCTPDYLLFASELKAIVASGLIEPKIDQDSLDDLFSLSYPCPPRTMLEGVKELMPAHLLEVRAGRRDLAQRKYWSIQWPLAGEHRTISRRDSAEELRSLLRLRVYDHLIADVPVGAYLSGGLDSSAICALMKDVTGDAPETFSVSFESPEHDESAFSQRVSSFLGGPSHTVVSGSGIAEHLPEMIWHTELPLQFPLALPLMQLAAKARSSNYSVVLTGEGADEIMGGYDCFRADKMRRMLDRPGFRFLRPYVYQQLYKWHKMPTGTVEMMLKNHHDSRDVKKQFGGVVPPWYDMWTTVGIDRSKLLAPSGRCVRPVDEAPAGFDALIPDDLDRMHPLDAGIVLEQATRLPAWILLIGDRASMSQGVETRVPLLDHDVVEFVSSLPPEHKMKGFAEKSALREAVRPYLPNEIADRQKRPFFTPISEWFFGLSGPEFVTDYLSTESIKAAGMFDPGLVREYLRQLQVVPRSSIMRTRLEWTLMLILSSQIFHQQFVRDRCLAPPGIRF